MTTYVYELCGPLINDAAVTKHAYEHAQAILRQRSPALKPGYPDTQCGVDRFLYNRRTAAYRANAHDITKGWAWEHLVGQIEQGHVALKVFTSHQADTLEIIRTQAHLRLVQEPKVPALVSMTVEDRMWRLRDWAARGPVIYFCAPWWVSEAYDVTNIASAEALEVFECKS
jgi:hypothetical protein